MNDDRWKPVWPWISALLIGLPLLYVASFGPACWITSRTGTGMQVVSPFYRPVIRAMFRGPGPLREPLFQYSLFGASEGACWILPPHVNLSTEVPVDRWQWSG
jgi:hypothetical protein